MNSELRKTLLGGCGEDFMQQDVGDIIQIYQPRLPQMNIER